MRGKFIYKLEIIGSILCMLYFAGCLKIMPPIEVSSEPLGGSLTQISILIPYLFIPFLVAIRWKNFVYACTRVPSILLLVVYVNFSVLWSETSSISLTAARWILVTFLFASYLSSRFKLKDCLWLLNLIFGIVAIESAIVCILFPFYGIHPTGEWCGIYAHKNDLGATMTLGACTSLHVAISKFKYSSIKYSCLLWGIFILSVILIFLADSTTSLMTVFTFFPLLLICKLMQGKEYKLQAICTLLSLSLIILLSLCLLDNLEWLVASQGKDLTFTGRTPMWLDLMNKIAERPFFGYGYGGFWSSSEALNIKAEYKWAGDAHNGFITLWLELGLAGVVLFTISLFQFIRKTIQKIISYARTWDEFFPMQFLVYMLMANFSESRLILPTMTFLTYIVILVSLTIEQKEFIKTLSSRKIFIADNIR